MTMAVTNGALIAALASGTGMDPGMLHAKQIAGGASKSTWLISQGSDPQAIRYVLRRDLGGQIYSDALSLSQEFDLLRIMHRSAVKVPEPVSWFDDLLGQPGYLMKHVPGVSVGTKVVRHPELAVARRALPADMAEQLARVHHLPIECLPSYLPRKESPALFVQAMYRDMDWVGEARPVLEVALQWLLKNAPEPMTPVMCHGDFRIGNILVGPEGLNAIIDWEFAHIGDPRGEISWALVKTWRFGRTDLRFGGIADAEEFVSRYNHHAGRQIAMKDLHYWELLGNVRWAVGASMQAARHRKGLQPDVEFAVLGRMGSMLECEILDLLEQI